MKNELYELKQKAIQENNTEALKLIDNIENKYKIIPDELITKEENYTEYKLDEINNNLKIIKWILLLPIIIKAILIALFFTKLGELLSKFYIN